MRISELARKAGVNIQTIRYYERRSLLRAPARTAGGYRAYLPPDLEQLRFIKWCQRLGFTLGEIRDLLPLHARVSGQRSPGGKELRDIASMLGEKLAGIDERVAALRQLRRDLAKALSALRASSAPECPASCVQIRGVARPDPKVARQPKNS